MEHPVPFIETNSDGKLSLNTSALDYLLSSPEPVGVISIAGKYRTGKSYLMNRFFQSSDGFSLGSTIQSKTKGIWLWAKPHPNDPNLKLVLLDTEGLYDVEKGDEQHDAQLFTLAILLSNCLVYNAVGALDDKLLKELYLVSELTEHIRTKDGQEEDGTHFGKYFPHLFLVLRDFFLELSIDGKTCTPDEYMENALKLKPGKSKKIQDYNQPRECIRDYFPKRKCFTLCKPTEDDAQLREIEKLDESYLKKEFVTAASKCIEFILQSAKAMTVEGSVMTGPRLIKMAEQYVEAMNNGAVPCITSTVQLLKTTECQKALQKALKTFDDEVMKAVPKMPVAKDALDGAQKVAHDAALRVYHKEALFDEDGIYMKQLAEQLEEHYQHFLKENSKASRTFCSKALKQCFLAVDGNLNSGLYYEKGGYKAYCADKEKALESYKKIPNKGPEADNALNEFMEDRKSLEDAIINADKALKDKDKELAKMEAERKREEEKARAAEEEQKRLYEDYMRQAADNQKMITEMQKEFERKQQELREEQKAEWEAKQAELERMREEGMLKQSEQFEELLNVMRQDKLRAEEAAEKQREEMRNMQKQHQDLIIEMKEQRKVSNQQLDTMRSQLDAMKKKDKPCIVM